MNLLEKIYDLTPEQSQLLHSEKVDNQLIEIREFENYRWLQIGGRFIQGLMDTDFPSQILLPNIQGLMSALLVCPQPNRLLNLGFGCGSIERFFIEKKPELDITSLESSEKVIHLAKEFFYISDQSHIVNALADEYLSNNKTLYDIILCDIFINEKHPACLYEEDFYFNVSNSLEKNGVLAVNLLPDSEQDVMNILLPMKSYFNNISLLEITNHFNAIIFASGQKLPGVNELTKQANDLFSKTELDLRDIPQRINRLLETV
jgi:spermidine synthase